MAKRGDGALLVEPWTLIHLAHKTHEDRAAAVLATPRISHTTAEPFTNIPMTTLEELEIAWHYIIWVLASVAPIVVPIWLCVSPSVTSLCFAIATIVSMTWPHGEWPVPPDGRLTMPLRNMKIASIFIRYFPMRVLLEDESTLIHVGSGSPTKKLLAGVPHGLFPIGFVLLGFCNFVLPWRRMKAASASAVLRLPIWRQVGLWNGGIDVSKASIVRALRAGSTVLVCMDGIAGMFEGQRRKGREVFLLRRRRGLVKIALEEGVPLVPFVCFGNTKAVEPITDPLGVMEALSRLLGISLIYPGGRFLLPVPSRVPITVAVGRALPLPTGFEKPGNEPSEAQIDVLHEQLLSEMSALYYRWRVAGGYGGVELDIV